MKNLSLPIRQNRREFLHGLGRTAGLAGVAIVIGLSTLRKRSPSTSISCTNQDLCCKCRLYKDCSLPQAFIARFMQK